MEHCLYSDMNASGADKGGSRFLPTGSLRFSEQQWGWGGQDNTDAEGGGTEQPENSEAAGQSENAGSVDGAPHLRGGLRAGQELCPEHSEPQQPHRKMQLMGGTAKSLRNQK